MRLIQFFRQLVLWLQYRQAAFVATREELEQALRRMPPRIVVDGDESLRAFAAALTRGEPATVPAQTEEPEILLVPPVGRVRDGYVKSRATRAREKLPMKGGMDMVLVACLGTCAALIMEWLSFAASTPHMILGPHAPHMAARAAAGQAAAQHLAVWAFRIAIPLLGAVAAAAFGWVAWQALGLGRPLQTSWRIEYRVQGRLVMARVRRRAA